MAQAECPWCEWRGPIRQTESETTVDLLKHMDDTSADVLERLKRL